jgi:hypothetical protein
MSCDSSAKEPDAETLSAIKRILDEPFDDAIAKKLQAATQAKPVVQQDFHTRPLENIEAHFKGPKYTTVPQIEAPLQDTYQTPPQEDPKPSKVDTSSERAGEPDLSALKPAASFNLEKYLTLRTGLLGAVAILIIAAPAYFVLLVLTFLFAGISVFLILGADRIWGLVEAHLNRLSQSDPEREQELRAKLDKWANRWDSILDRFPEGTVDGLYMPDFSINPAESEPVHDAILADRLKRMHGQV